MLNIENRRGKIKEPPSEEVVRWIIQPGINADIDHAYQCYLDINKAHVLMLAKQGIIADDVANSILKVTDEMAKMGKQPTFPIDPSKEDTYFNLEHYLIERTGLDIGGQQHTARSRNDLLATVTRLYTRDFYLDICDLFNKMREAVLQVAKNNTDAVMSGYTHLQPSEPITFAHYCSAILSALERDYRRISAVYQSLNLCPLGGGSMGSTTFDIDRDMTAQLLGFDEPLDNSIDCVASRDYASELLAALSLACNTFSRFCFDLYIWATPDYGYVEVADSEAVCSSIMPQKKNPWTLEHVKGKCAHIEGFFISCINAMKNTPYTHNQDVNGEGTYFLWTALVETKACLELLTKTVEGITLHKDKMVKTARGNFCTVTELANYLVRHDHISFRAAHEIVALVVDYMITHDKKANEIGTDVVNDIFYQLFGKKTCMTDDDIQRALDPVLNAQSKTVKGGTAEKEVLRQLARRQQHLEQDQQENSQRRAHLCNAKETLEKAVQDRIFNG